MVITLPIEYGTTLKQGEFLENRVKLYWLLSIRVGRHPLDSLQIATANVKCWVLSVTICSLCNRPELMSSGSFSILRKRFFSNFFKFLLIFSLNTNQSNSFLVWLNSRLNMFSAGICWLLYTKSPHCLKSIKFSFKFLQLQFPWHIVRLTADSKSHSIFLGWQYRANIQHTRFILTFLDALASLVFKLSLS